MREEKLNFGTLIRIFISLLPILFGMPTLATIFCAYNIAMSFIAFGPLTTFVSSLGAIAISMLLSSSQGPAGELAGLIYGLQATLCAWGCIAGLFKKKDFYYGLTLSSLGMLIPQFLYLNHIAHSNGMSLADMLVPKAEDVKIFLLDAISQIQPGIENEIINIDQLAQLTRTLTIMTIPAALIISAMVLAYIVMWAVAAPLRKQSFEKVHAFSHIRLPRACAIVFVLAIVSLYYVLPVNSTILTSLIVNVAVVIFAMAFFAGFAIVDFYLRKFIPLKLFRFLIYATVLLNFFPIFVLIALIDAFADFRKLSKNNVKKDGGDNETEERNV